MSYSNYKRHLKNAHPSLNHDDEVLEIDGDHSGSSSGNGNLSLVGRDGNSVKYLGHQIEGKYEVEKCFLAVFTG